MAFLCETCAKSYAQLKTLNRHRRETHVTNLTHHECSDCGKAFTRNWDLQRHTTNVHAKRPRLEIQNYRCGECGVSCKDSRSLASHIKTHKQERPRLEIQNYQCGECGVSYKDRRSLVSHIKTHNPDFLCPHCGKRDFKLPQNLRQHERKCAQREDDLIPYSPPQVDEELNLTSYSSSTQPGPSTAHQPHSTDISVGNRTSFKCIQKTFKNRLKTYELNEEPSDSMTMNEFFVFIFDALIYLLYTSMKEFSNIKANLFMECEFHNAHNEHCKKNFKTKNVPLTLTSNLSDFCSDVFDKLIREKEECTMVGSGWTFARILRFEVRVNKYNPLKGAGWIKLPQKFVGSQSIVNIENMDDRCFMYAMLAKFVARPKLLDSYTNDVKAEYDWSGIQFPTPVKQLYAFEEKNNISINVYGLEKCKLGVKNGKQIYTYKIYPIKVCNQEVKDKHTDLLFVKTSDSTHYIYIKDFNSFVRPQLTSHTTTISVCKRCLSFFQDRNDALSLSAEERLSEHKKYCAPGAPVRLDLSPDQTIRFKNHERSQRSRFCIYGDFECLLKPVNNDNHVNNHNPEESSTAIKQNHEAYSYCYHIKDSKNELTETKVYRGEDAAMNFMVSIKNDAVRIGDLLYAHRRLKAELTDEEEDVFKSATICYLCHKEFTDETKQNGKLKDPKVRDHYHAAPYNYRGAAHRSCNLRYHEQGTINVYFHNLSKYDGHIIVRVLGLDDEDINVIANTEETYISFTKNVKYKYAKHGHLRLRFIDTLRFMPSSLSKLVANLPKENLRITKDSYPDPAKFDLLCRKGVFPYDYVKSLQILDDETLPPKHSFHSALTQEDISDEDYDHAQTVWNTFGICNLGEYSDLYNKSDVLLLADVYENFRDMCIKEYDLDPAHYITLPSFAWDVMLKMTEVQLDTIQDFDQYLFIEQGIRGGITQVCTRYAKAKNKYLVPDRPNEAESVRPDDEQSKYIVYLDANNLYGYALSQSLPTGGLRWLSRDEIDNLDVPNLPENGDTGYILEVDLAYPDHLHDAHRDLPFCAEHGTPPSGKFPKLMTTLNNKTNYKIHYINLKQALKNNLKMTKIHRVIAFNQSPWLKIYIDHNTSLRKSARNEFEKDLFKLMNNAVYGKSMENARKHIDVRLVCKDTKFEKLVAKPNFVDRTYFTDDLVLVNLAKTRIILDKPIYIGMCVLELSKCLMYTFHYDTMKVKYGDRLKLLYTDTDSFVYLINSEDVYKEFAAHIEDFDTSDYPTNHHLYSSANKKVIGKFKDEVNGRIVKEFIGLRSKLYCMVVAGEEEDHVIKRAKGVSRSVVHKVLTVDDYRKCLDEQRLKYTINSRFQSRHHNISTVETNKLSLSPYDDKRVILPGGCETLPHGHRSIVHD